MRVGLGFDAHAFAAGRRLILGGVTLPGAPGLGGHSDADVLSHAIADALLGAAGLGDLGSFFPDDGRWKDASSLDILKVTADEVSAAGYRIGNIDSTVIAERPKLAPHLPRMATNAAEALRIPAGRVSVKATTSDGLGFTGRGEGIAALAVALVEPRGATVAS